MNPDKDAYGQEILAYFQNKESFELIERDDGSMSIGNVHSYFAEFEDWPEIQQRIIPFAKGRVLDIGSGAGRVSLYLQNKKHIVTAIDNSPLAIKVCKERGVKRAMVLPIEKIGVFKPNAFDTVIMFGNNFGLFGNKKKAKTLLKKLHLITSPDAVILAENIDPYKTNDPVHLFYHKRNTRKGRMPGQLRLRIRYRNYIGSWFDYLLVSKEEMKMLLEGTGWKIKKFIDSDNYFYAAVIDKE